MPGADAPRFPGDLPAAFGLPAEPVRAERHGQGLIHQTWRAVYEAGGRQRQYLHQAVNTRVFDRPDQVMDNIQRVSRHLAAKRPAMFARTLHVRPTAHGELLWRDAGGQPWRTYDFVEATVTLQEAANPDQAYQAALAFGRFIAALADFEADSLHTTIPHFHDTPWRWRQLQRALEIADRDRRSDAAAELAFAASHRDLAGLLTPAIRAGRLPRRVVHNDTKINNLLFDPAQGSVVCVVDLDTVMPGYAVTDFADLARHCLSPTVDLDLFQGLLRGFLDGCGTVLTPTEVEMLPRAVKLLAYELGLRFLTDFLQGDAYFRVDHPGHNLQRCRAQFDLVKALLAIETDLVGRLPV